MPINLTNPFDGGTAHDGATWPQAKIVKFDIENEHTKRIFFDVEFGDTVNGEWTKAPVEKMRCVIENSDTDAAYDDFITLHGALFNSVAAALYDRLQADEPVKCAGAQV